MPKFQMIAAYLQARLASKNDEGATAVEYGLMVSLVALVMIVGVKAFGSHLSSFFSGLVSQF
ncbi:Flp family type IVb pilin [Actinoplanes sp. TBRC 11911]|uniref:Flp family type IVb pilin n=1 Tax=Actinoplanes sp. TBRC 11911 TaxID=2729386 RepID=UPI001B7D5DDF|nr:Flp family type IVb pilin [Actinoplanes sp. TBRC 11911]